MDDMNAFERQVAAEVSGEMPPSRSVDVVAVFDNAVGTPVRRWRVQPLFSATRALVAGAIVALFGGLLLVGLLAQPSDEQAAPAAASPSPTATTATGLLPGADLVTEEVAMGVHRLLSDGTHDLSEDIWHVAATADGDVWVERHGFRYFPATENSSGDIRSVESLVFRLGHPEEFVLSRYPDLETEEQEVGLTTSRGGAVVVGDPDTSRGVLTFDGAEWAPAQGCLDVAHFDGFSGPDGSCWFVPPTSEVVRRLPGANPDEDDGVTKYDLDELGMVPSTAGLSGWAGWPLMQLAMSGDGTIWAAGDMAGTAEAQFSVFDGESWERIPAMEPVEGLSASPSNVYLSIAGGLNATLWVSHWDRARSVLHAWHWDEAGWTAYGPIETSARAVQPEGASPTRTGLHISDDGLLWFDGLVRFDGVNFDVFDVPASTASVEPRINSVSHGPDGSLWLTVADDAANDPPVCTTEPERWCAPTTDGLYVITPEATATTPISSKEDEMIQIKPIATAVIAAAALATATPAVAQEAMSPVEVTGTAIGSLGTGCYEVDYAGTHEDIGVDAWRFICSTDDGMPWSFSDPRLEGTVTRINEESRIDLDDGSDIYLASTAFRIENDEGVWQERPRTWLLPDGLMSYDWLPEEVLVFDGHGAYDGLVAVLRAEGLREFRGSIMDARVLPPSPESALME